MSVLQPPEPNRCTVCGASPIHDGREYCSLQCYRADELVCDICDAFAPQPMAHMKRHHPEEVDFDADEDDAGPIFETPVPDAWSVELDDDTPGHRLDGDESPTCAECGATVSHAFHRQWADNEGVLHGCPECLPRSVRFGDDVYGRAPADVEDFDGDTPNRGRDAGGVQRDHLPGESS